MRLAARLALRSEGHAAAEVAWSRRACRSPLRPALAASCERLPRRKRRSRAGLQRRIPRYVLRGSGEGKPNTSRARDAGFAGSLAVKTPLHFSISCRGPCSASGARGIPRALGIPGASLANLGAFGARERWRLFEILYDVVPAKAGTHNPSAKNWKQVVMGPGSRSASPRLAGTTNINSTNTPRSPLETPTA